MAFSVGCILLSIELLTTPHSLGQPVTSRRAEHTASSTSTGAGTGAVLICAGVGEDPAAGGEPVDLAGEGLLAAEASASGFVVVSAMLRV